MESSDQILESKTWRKWEPRVGRRCHRRRSTVAQHCYFNWVRNFLILLKEERRRKRRERGESLWGKK
ncbi:unnamed protein product [Linum trigynum]|uniref:Uncharacterized protein n=1 Tax=Linum trigynum TaxID=586398 RepID=A0AAV2GPG2_9ROSI